MRLKDPSRFDQLRARIERGFNRWGGFCYDHPWWIIGLSAAVIAFFSSFLSNIEVDTSTEGYLRASDPARMAYDEFQREFGRDERILMLIESPGDIVNDSFLRRLQTLHRDLEQIPQVDKVDSLINARRTTGSGDELIVRDLLEEWPRTEADFARLRGEIKANPVYQKQLVNTDLTRTVIVLTPDTYSAIGNAAADAADDLSAGFSDAPAPKAEFITDEETYAIIAAMQAAAQAHASPDFKIGLAGSPYMMHQMTFILGRDMFLFSGVGILLISVLLLLIYKRWVMVAMPIAIAALALYFTIALMAFLRIPVTTSVQILPSLLLAVGVSNVVHVFTVFFQGVDRGLDKRAAIVYALGHSGLPIVMTSLTTAGGLLSFITADIKPVADIGIISPIGIMNTLGFSLVLLPALIAVIPMRDKGLRDEASAPMQRFLRGCADISTTYPRRMVLAWAAMLGVSLAFAAGIRPSHFPLHWFPPGHELRDMTEILDREFGGGSYMEIVIDTGKENGLHEPALLQAADQAIQFANGLHVNDIALGKTISLLDINKELHQALNGNDPAYYRIPDDRDLIAQELLLFENSGSDDLKDFVDTQFSKMRITVKMPFVDGTRYPGYLNELEPGIARIIGDQASISFTGIINLLSRTVKVLISDTIVSYAIAFIVITPMMMFLVGSLRIGLISMIPNLAPVIVTLALMAILDIPLDAFTLLVGSITLGLAVDDTIHFMHNFKRYYAEGYSAQEAVRETLRTTGKAMLITSVVLTVGFLVNLFATMSNLQNFGLLTGFCIIVAFFADVLLAPALMTLVVQWKEKHA